MIEPGCEVIAGIAEKASDPMMPSGLGGDLRHQHALAGDTADPQGSRTGYGLSVCAALECNQKFVVEIVTLTGGNIAVGGIGGRLPEHLRGGRRHADTG